MTVMTRSTTRMSASQLTSAAGVETMYPSPQMQQQENLLQFAIHQTRIVKQTFDEEFPNESLPLADIFREVCGMVRQGFSIQHDDAREERCNQREQERHDQIMTMSQQDHTWLETIYKKRDKMYSTFLNEALMTLYGFFVMHLIWHFIRFRQVWSLTGMFFALQYSICGQCMLESAGIEWQDSSYMSYFSSFFPSWTTVGSYMGLYLTCTTICILKAIFAVFWAVVTAMIVPMCMVKYMAAAIIVLTMLSNVLELVPFIMSWTYMGIMYFLMWTFCYVKIWSVCRQSLRTLKDSGSSSSSWGYGINSHGTSTTTPSKEQVNAEVHHLSDLTDTYMMKHKIFLVAVVMCCLVCGVREFDRKGY